jgi:hypothetical protein
MLQAAVAMLRPCVSTLQFLLVVDLMLVMVPI